MEGQSVLFVCVFLSGAAALVHELAWLRVLDLFFGVSGWAVATTLSVFMLGLGCGGRVFGWVAERSSAPIRLYRWLEIGAGVLSLAGYAVVKAGVLDGGYSRVYLGGDPVWLGVMRGLLAAAPRWRSPCS